VPRLRTLLGERIGAEVADVDHVLLALVAFPDDQPILRRSWEPARSAAA
jgi:hypothetical protein